MLSYYQDVVLFKYLSIRIVLIKLLSCVHMILHHAVNTNLVKLIMFGFCSDLEDINYIQTL